METGELTERWSSPRTMASPSDTVTAPSTNGRVERLRILLENYVDVVEQGLRDQRGEGEHLPMMSRAWNHASYRELDRVLVQLREREPPLYWHLSQLYVYAPTRRVLVCANPHCTATFPSWVRVSFHKHGRRHVPFVPRVIRQPKVVVDDVQVGRAIAWLEREWQGEVFLPDELMHLAA